MKRVTETFLLPCTPDVFWQVSMDPAYLRALFLDGLGFNGFEVLEISATTRKLRVVPRMNLPEPLAKIVGDAFAYEEHGELDRGRSEWKWRMVQPRNARLPELIGTSGTVRVEPIGDGQCRRTDELILEGKLFGLGRIIEAAAEKEARAAWGKEPPFFARWLERKGTPP
jgi:hypothetical protein